MPPRPSRLALLALATAVALLITALPGCTSQQLAQAQTQLTQAQQADTAAIAATTSAQTTLNAAPTTGPAQTQAEQVLTQAQTVEAQADKALSTAQQAVTALQNAGTSPAQVLASPVAQQTAAAVAAAAIPAPWGLLVSALAPSLMLAASSMFTSRQQSNSHQASVSAFTKILAPPVTEHT